MVRHTELERSRCFCTLQCFNVASLYGSNQTPMNKIYEQNCSPPAVHSKALGRQRHKVFDSLGMRIWRKSPSEVIFATHTHTWTGKLFPNLFTTVKAIRCLSRFVGELEWLSGTSSLLHSGRQGDFRISCEKFHISFRLLFCLRSFVWCYILLGRRRVDLHVN